ncbi:MAG: hypothetical protein L0Y58_23825 [Verrucomicrobia subdivision 3 bacterium]|nr:hypothetical protein [Limisphaerales bacterium]
MSLLDALLLDPALFNIYVANRADGIGGSGTISDPYDGSTQAKFDTVMRNLPSTPPVRVHLGPGTFQTQGYYDGAASGYGWQPKAGMKIIGSGVDVTTLQLVNNLSANNHYFAVGHPLASGGQPVSLDFCEVSDLTIDCNLANQSNTVACGAVRLMGNHVRIRRVKAKNWGNKISANLGYVFAVIVSDPATGASLINCGIEDCMAVLPGTATTGEMLIFHAGGKEHDATNTLEGFGTAPFIRNCFVDCDSTGALGNGTDYRAKFRALSMTSCKGGIVEGNQIHNTWYGGPYLTKWSVRDMVVRNNVYKNVVSAPYLNLPAPGTAITNSSLVLPNPSPSTVVEVTTSSNHALTAGDRVKISGALPTDYNGVFVVDSITPPNKFRYRLATRPAASTAAGSTQKVLGVERFVFEENEIEMPLFAAPLPQPIAVQTNASSLAALGLAYVYGDVLIRDNRIHYLDTRFDSTYLGFPIKILGARNLIARNNVVESAPANPLQNSLSGTVKYFNNEMPTGVLVQGVNLDAGNKKYDELATQAEDATMLTLI